MLLLYFDTDKIGGNNTHTMLRYYVKKSFNEELEEVRDISVDHAWIFGDEVTEKELSLLSERYKLDPNILYDVRDAHELPRVEYSNGALYLFLRMPVQNSRGAIISVPFMAAIKNGYLFTLSSKRYFTPKDIFEDTQFSMKSNKHVFLQLISYVIRSYGVYVHKTGAFIRSTEARLHSHEVDNKDFIKFVSVESNLNMYKTNLLATKAVLQRLNENKHGLFGERDSEFIDDLELFANQLTVEVDSHTTSIASIRNAYSTISNNILNKRMKTLTLMTLLVALPNVFYGMFGMNVPLPFAHEPWAYTAVTGISIIMVIGVYLIMRRLRI